jgi:hypothetical protein
MLYSGRLTPQERSRLQADLALSLDVIFHLVEEDVFVAYMRDLFACARDYVVVYSSDFDMSGPEPHMRHRAFTGWIETNEPGWTLAEHTANPYPYDERAGAGSLSDFFVYERSRTPEHR